MQRKEYEFLFQCLHPADQAVVVLAHDGQPFSLFDYSIRRKILASSNVALLRAGVILLSHMMSYDVT